MKELIHILVRVVFKPGIIDRETTYKTETVKIAVQNATYVIIEDNYFTKLQKSGNDNFLFPIINKAKMSSQIDNSVFGTYVEYEYYGTKNKRPATIRKQMQKYIDEKFGLMANTDLSFITDEKES